MSHSGIHGSAKTYWDHKAKRNRKKRVLSWISVEYVWT